MKKLFLAVALAASLYGDIFSQGGKNFGVTLGTSHSYGTTYTIVGVSASYFIVDNLLAGLEYRGWFGGEPSINEVSVPFTYMVPLQGKFRPYLGGFYRHTFMGSSDYIDYEDYDVYGGRVGVSMINGRNSYFSVGWVQEYYDNDIGESSNGYPEFAVGMSF
jgi:hypothetical protein